MEDSYLDTYWENQYDIEPSFEQHEDYNAFEEQQVFEDREDRDPEDSWEEPDYDYNRDEAPEHEPREDFGHFGEMGLWD